MKVKVSFKMNNVMHERLADFYDAVNQLDSKVHVTPPRLHFSAIPTPALVSIPTPTLVSMPTLTPVSIPTPKALHLNNEE
jgi:hypothetical protein